MSGTCTTHSRRMATPLWCRHLFAVMVRFLRLEHTTGKTNHMWKCFRLARCTIRVPSGERISGFRWVGLEVVGSGSRNLDIPRQLSWFDPH